MFQGRVQPPFSKQTKGYKLIAVGLGKISLIMEYLDKTSCCFLNFLYFSFYSCFLAAARCGIFGQMKLVYYGCPFYLYIIKSISFKINVLLSFFCISQCSAACSEQQHSRSSVKLYTSKPDPGHTHLPGTQTHFWPELGNLMSPHLMKGSLDDYLLFPPLPCCACNYNNLYQLFLFT